MSIVDKKITGIIEELDNQRVEVNSIINIRSISKAGLEVELEGVKGLICDISTELRFIVTERRSEVFEIEIIVRSATKTAAEHQMKKTKTIIEAKFNNSKSEFNSVHYTDSEIAFRETDKEKLELASELIIDELSDLNKQTTFKENTEIQTSFKKVVMETEGGQRYHILRISFEMKFKKEMSNEEEIKEKLEMRLNAIVRHTELKTDGVRRNIFGVIKKKLKFVREEKVEGSGHLIKEGISKLSSKERVVEFLSSAYSLEMLWPDKYVKLKIENDSLNIIGAIKSEQNSYDETREIFKSMIAEHTYPLFLKKYKVDLLLLENKKDDILLKEMRTLAKVTIKELMDAIDKFGYEEKGNTLLPEIIVKKVKPLIKIKEKDLGTLSDLTFKENKKLNHFFKGGDIQTEKSDVFGNYIHVVTVKDAEEDVQAFYHKIKDIGEGVKYESGRVSIPVYEGVLGLSRIISTVDKVNREEERILLIGETAEIMELIEQTKEIIEKGK